MLDQSFSVKNFNRIYDLDRKNKGSLEKEHFPDAYKIRRKLYWLNKIGRLLVKRHKQKKITHSWFENKKEKLNSHIDKRKEQLSNEINSKLEDIVNVVRIKGYGLPLLKSSFKIGGKDVYSIGETVEAIFVSRQIQYTLSSIYNVKVNNRELIVSRLSSLIEDSSPKYIIRADVEKFYESIKHKNMLDILHSSPKLSVTVRRVLTQLIRSYSKISGSSVGLPRGVGISAYLSEVYMGNIDVEISKLPDITYYERYVDDIIAVFSPTKSENTSVYLPSIRSIVEKRELTLNEKTTEINLFNETNKKFEYLGYLFHVDGINYKIKISQQRKKRLKDRIDESFNQYAKDKIKTTRKAYDSVLSRIRFLTGNTRLYNSKSKAFVGVYFSNKFITDTSDLRALDSYLTHKVSLLTDQKLKTRLSKLSFEKGFQEQIFRKFTIEDLSNISKAWKNG